MKIECPSCHLSGKVNELELPPEGRELECPRCKAPFHVNKPASGGKQDMMNMCPACQYSTFTDEMFAVCPKCGLVAGEYRVRKNKEAGQKRHDQEMLTRSHRNPDLVAPVADGAVPEVSKAPQPILVAGWSCVVLGGALFLYGFSGLMNYQGKDWQAVLAEQSLEPVTSTSVFFSLGFMPWVTTLFSVYLVIAAVLFLRLQAGSLKRMKECTWGGLALGVIHETVDFIKWLQISSSTPSLDYIFTGIISSVLWILLWSVPSVILIWYLGSGGIGREFAGEES